MKLLRKAIKGGCLTALFAALAISAGLPVVGESADILAVSCSSCPGSVANLAPAVGCGMSQCSCCVAPSRENPTTDAPIANVPAVSPRIDVTHAQSCITLPRVAETTAATFFAHLRPSHSAKPLYLTYSVFLI